MGGGFAGIEVIKPLLREEGVEITLINDNNYFVFTPLLHEVAIGSLDSNDVIFEYSTFFKNENFDFYRRKVTGVDFKKKEINVGDNLLKYDFLVLASGSSTNYFGIKGVEEHCLFLKSIDDAIEIKKAIVKKIQGFKKYANINIVGAGPTGVELAFEIKQFLGVLNKYNKVKCKINIIQFGNNILPNFSEKIIKYTKDELKKEDIKVYYNARVLKVSNKLIFIKNQEIKSDITIWTTGVKSNTKFLNKKYLDFHGDIFVDDKLQVRDEKDVFALGDVVIIDELFVPKLAQVAVQESRIVASNIIFLIKGENLGGYVFKLKGDLLSLGNFNAAGEIFGVFIKGVFEWFVWRSVYLLKMPGLKNKIRIVFKWTINLFSKRNIVEK